LPDRPDCTRMSSNNSVWRPIQVIAVKLQSSEAIHFSELVNV
jgi:accessory colonization factor AcfC